MTELHAALAPRVADWRELEAQSGTYGEVAGETDRDLAIVIPAGFDEVMVDGSSVRQAEISYPTDRASLIWGPDAVAENPGDYGFHYVPYNFDSRPESDYFERVLRELNLRPDKVQDIYFTGAITDPKKTDLSFAYQRDGREHRYTPDFVVHARGDRWLLVEVKMTARRDDSIEGREGLKAEALRDIESRNPGRVVYRIVFADAIVSPTDVDAVRTFLAGP
jgi:type III restriction enzyme